MSASDNLTVRIFKHARSKIPFEVMIEHTDAFDWTEVSKVVDITDICAIGGRCMLPMLQKPKNLKLINSR
jgi:hypothetical protein